ncbi:MAG: peptidoglycan DD-metalloendopeptidase family protein [Candidatus Promineifilaceae bacterium]
MADFKFEAWPTDHRKITQYFGVNPDIYAQFGLPGHDGIDIRAPEGSNIYAVAPGRVERVQPVPDGKGYGIHVRVAHADGYLTIYAHLQKALVREGNRVQAGTLLGLADSTGFSSGSHLHLGLRRDGETYKGWPYNIVDPTPFLLPLLSWQEPSGPFTDGWVYEATVTVMDGLAQVNAGDAHLREGPDLDAEIIDLIPEGTMLIVTGEVDGESLPVRVSTAALDSSEVSAAPPDPAPESPLPPESVLLAWAWQDYLEFTGHYAKVGRHGVNLRSAPTRDSRLIGQVQWGKVATLVGYSINGYAPLFFNLEDVLNSVPDATVQEPQRFPGSGGQASADLVDGWVMQHQVTLEGETAVAGRVGATVRSVPRRNGRILGIVAVGVKMSLGGAPTGEYVPVKVKKGDLRKIETAEKEEPQPDPDPQPLGQAAIGLHASADPHISDEEIVEFGLFRPSMIKVLSFHNPDALRKLAANHPNASWVVRAFLDFGGRSINPQRFFNDTISDMQRTLTILDGRNVVIELHNEPNIYAEGLGTAWGSGAEFAAWWTRLLRLYRHVFPNHRFVYPGLSPGPTTDGVREDHVRFLEASRKAIEEADGLGVHIYWSTNFSMTRALAVLDDAVNRFNDKPIWVTEASNNQNGTSPSRKAYEYLAFWKELQRRPTVEGVTYFVASAINPDFQHEVFLGKGMSRIIGAR